MIMILLSEVLLLAVLIYENGMLDLKEIRSAPTSRVIIVQTLLKTVEKFIQYFLDHESQYYIVSEGDNPMWVAPSKSPPRILLCK